MGSLRIFHMKEELPTMASFPLILREYTTLIQATMI